MIEPLEWDTGFFGRKIGILKRLPSGRRPLQALLRAVEDAGEEGFRYIIYKMDSVDAGNIRLLEGAGFYLTDIGVTWECGTEGGKRRAGVVAATDDDIGDLKKMARGLFAFSRFYHDPFFKKSEGERLFKAWVENSVRGKAADAVLWVRGAGFIVLRKASARRGEITLIGVVKGMRGKGVGRALVDAGLEWLKRNGIKTVRVRTPLVNSEGMNFYSSLGFRVAGSDVVMAIAPGKRG